MATYKVGDEVLILDTDDQHYLNVGTIGEVIEVHEYGLLVRGYSTRYGSGVEQSAAHYGVRPA